MHSKLARSLQWSPTIALSWLWGLGFFYAFHVTLQYGWLGFLSFATTNCIGLFLFGWFLGAPNVDVEKRLLESGGAYNTLFLLSQLCALGITIFGLIAYVLIPLGLPTAPAAIAASVLVLFACAVGQGATLPTLKLVHAAYLVVGVVAALCALPTLLATHAPAPPLASFDERFYGLVAPSVVGFFLGPWTDIQHWQRAAGVQKSGGDLRVAYAGGAALFFVVLCINAALAAAAGGAGIVTPADGVTGYQAAVALALGATQAKFAIGAFVLWAAIAAASTIDSAYCAIRWHMTALTARSSSPLLAFVPSGFVASPLWLVATSFGVALAMVAANLSQIYLMVPYTTLFVGAALCLFAETRGARRIYDGVLGYLVGLAAMLLFLAGYLAPSALLLTLSTLIAAIGAIPMLLHLFGWAKWAPSAPAPVEPTEIVGVAAPMPTKASSPTDALAYHGFDGRWFLFHMIPTYDDTNSVGNIYFANYIRWVGKARELFFNVCVPQFDLKNTDFYILTRSVKHDFKREGREFEPVTVKIRIGSYNRKFCTLEHEIYSETQGLLGSGSQSLMFADAKTYQPLDIPRIMMEGFLPYLPKPPREGLYSKEALSLGGE